MQPARRIVEAVTCLVGLDECRLFAKSVEEEAHPKSFSKTLWGIHCGAYV